MSNSLWPCGLQHTRLPHPSLSLEVCSNSCPLTQWCHPTISSSVSPFSCPQSFPASGSFPVSQLFASGGQSIGASASVLPMNIQGWFTLRLTGLISLLCKGLSWVSSSTTIQKHQFFGTQPSLDSVKWGWQKAWSPSSSHQKGTFLGEMCAGAGGINSFSATTRAIECSFQPGNLVDPVSEMTSLEAAGDFFSLISGIHVGYTTFIFVLKQIQYKTWSTSMLSLWSLGYKRVLYLLHLSLILLYLGPRCLIIWYSSGIIQNLKKINPRAASHCSETNFTNEINSLVRTVVLVLHNQAICLKLQIWEFCFHFIMGESMAYLLYISSKHMV